MNWFLFGLPSIALVICIVALVTNIQAKNTPMIVVMAICVIVNLVSIGINVLRISLF